MAFSLKEANDKYEQAKSIGMAFVTHYYETFKRNRTELIQMYHPMAWFEFESKKGFGRDEIKEKLESLAFQQIDFQITTVDVQPTHDDGVIILVVGRLRTDNDPPHPFGQTFLLKADSGNFFICHDMFRLSIHDSA